MSSSAAAIVASQITTPTSRAFAVWNSNEPNSIAVAGTTVGGFPGDEVDIDCFSASGVQVLEGGVVLPLDGSFSVPSVSLERAAGKLCRLRAVTTGTTPSDPTPFAGPLLAVGQRRLEYFLTGPQTNRPFDSTPRTSS